MSPTPKIRCLAEGFHFLGSCRLPNLHMCTDTSARAALSPAPESRCPTGLPASKLEMKKSHSLWRFALLSDLGTKQQTNENTAKITSPRQVQFLKLFHGRLLRSFFLHHF